MNDESAVTNQEPKMPKDEMATGLSRRRMIAGTAVAGVATAFGATIAFAQSDDSTPAADSSTTTEAGTPAVGGETETTNGDATDILARVDEEIAAVQADRDAAGSRADLTTVDELLTQASGLRDKAHAATDADERRRLARAALATARAAGNLIEAQLSAYGLPSQQAPASRILANANERIVALGDEITAGADADADAALASAQQLYTVAYDAYNAGTYSQAAKTARVAEQLAQVAAFLSGAEVKGDMGGFGRGERGINRLPGNGGPGGRNNGGAPGSRDDDTDSAPDDEQDANSNEPVEVPSPDF